MEGLDYLRSLAEWKGGGGFSLATMSSLMSELKNPQDDVRVIHIGGTNGKGSVSAATAAILGASGACVGLYISPHLAHINERFLVDGSQISDEILDKCGAEVKAAARSSGIIPTFFEGITAAAFLAAKLHSVDWLVLEVGLGGALDATNIVSNPAVSAIVSIDYDHMAVLGNTITQIATEKSGIIKSGSPLVTGALNPEALTVIRKRVREVGALSHYEWSSDYMGLECSTLDQFNYSFKDEAPFLIKKSLKGTHQIHNMSVAATICKVATGNAISRSAIQQGISSVFWPGRLEEINFFGRSILIDCAHNIGGISSLTTFLREREIYDATIVFGVLQDKDWAEMVNLLRPHFREWLVATPDNPRAMPAANLVGQLSRLGINAIAANDLQDLIERIVNHDSANDKKAPVIIAGSMYLVGKLRELLMRSLPHLQEQRVWKKQLRN